MLLKISNNKVTILGEYVLTVSNTPTIILKIPSANAGIHSTQILIASNNSALKACPIAGALSIIALHIPSIASAMTPTIEGISSNIPVIVTLKASTKAAAPTAPAADNIEKAVANAITPAPAAKHATPNNATAPLIANITGATGSKAYPATPIIAIVAAIETIPFTISSTDILPKDCNTGTIRFNAVAMITKAAELASILPDIPDNNSNPAHMANIPAIAAPALPKSGHCICPNLLHTSANISNASPIITNEVAERNVFFDIPDNNSNPAHMANIPAIAAPALPKSGHCICPNLLHTSANISNAAPIITNEVAERNNLVGLICFIRN